MPGDMGQPVTTTQQRQPALTIRNLRKWYRTDNGSPPVLAIDSISVDIYPGEFVSIVGASGCGKSTLLNCVAGLLPYDGGELLLSGRPITGPGPERAMVFQDPSLLPWRTVLGNVVYGVELQKKMPKARARERGRELLRLVGLADFETRFPFELSGGMRHRVNLARALAVDPQVLLLDEPFGALDSLTREQMQTELLRIWERDRKTVLLVTHDIQEAVYLSDKVIVLTPRPARVETLVPITLPRPRPIRIKRDPEFLRLTQHIWEVLHREQLRE